MYERLVHGNRKSPLADGFGVADAAGRGCYFIDLGACNYGLLVDYRLYLVHNLRRKRRGRE
ncbi:hypothetical protein FDZ71_04465 [bacterium]|nr:MAG: hypothetical protein FDZ71_04465 [bacterium]